MRIRRGTQEVRLRIHDSIEHLRAQVRDNRTSGRPIALVPTMGYLHDGHLELIRHASRLAPDVYVSVFVNRLQFGPTEDFARYPRDLHRDSAMAEAAGATDLFAPGVEELTPEGTRVRIVPGHLSDHLCGRSRPGHFAGVLTIVAKLFNLVQPDVAVFGWKDAQQLIIINRMVEELNFPVRIEGVETVREPDGLAMSSRNTYLTDEQRLQAPAIYRALCRGRDMALANPRVDLSAVERQIADEITSSTSGRVDYVQAVSRTDLQPLVRFEPGNTMIAAAVFLGSTRLIDNVRF
jgi:pantoate--beta-alanine ligase